MIDKSFDEELQSILAEVESKFRQLSYVDTISEKQFKYNLFVPENYEPSHQYPLVIFITDSSVVGQDTTAALEQGYGAIIWATQAEQLKNPCIILAPEYPENIIEKKSCISHPYIESTLRLLKKLQDTYSIDSNRLYITGQSMGCMTALYLNATYPNIFAASIYVDGQWDSSILSPLEKQKFIYFSAEGDEKAFKGMSELKAMFHHDGIPFSESRLNAKATSDVINNAIKNLVAEGNNSNFLSWETGSVLPDGVRSEGTNEHMYSFDHAYKVSAVRAWLFVQSK